MDIEKILKELRKMQIEAFGEFETANDSGIRAHYYGYALGIMAARDALIAAKHEEPNS